MERKIYRDIVDHEHFNPRVVETVSTCANSNSLTDEEYCEFVRRKFDDPSDLWAHPFENQISSLAREILVVLWSFSGAVELEILREACLAFNSADSASGVALKFRSALRELTGNFILCDRHEHAGRKNQHITYVKFQNPSVEEFIERFLSAEPTWTDALAQSTTHFAQVERLYGWATSTGRSRGSPLLPSRFHVLLHGRAAKGEHRIAGQLYRFEGSTELKYFQFDYDEVGRTHTLLKVAVSAYADDDRAQEIWSRVTTNDGWRPLLRNAAQYLLAARGVRRLVEWILNQHDYEGERQRSSASFQAMFSELILMDETWESGVRGLAELQKAAVAFGMTQTQQHIVAIERVATQSVDGFLQHESDAQQIDSETSALRELATIVPFEVARLVHRMEVHGAGLRAEEGPRDSKDTSSQAYADSAEAGGDIDLDGMFSSLLER